jgi:hypothetical protein
MTQASLEHGLRLDAVAFLTSFVRRTPKQPREQKHLNAILLFHAVQALSLS